MTAVAQEMLELADEYDSRAKFLESTYIDEADLKSVRKYQLIVTALRESALSRNEVVGERKI